MLLKVLVNPRKFSHHRRLINKLIAVNLLMPDLTVSDKGGVYVRDSEVCNVEYSIRSIIRKGDNHGRNKVHRLYW